MLNIDISCNENFNISQNTTSEIPKETEYITTTTTDESMNLFSNDATLYCHPNQMVNVVGASTSGNPINEENPNHKLSTEVLKNVSNISPLLGTENKCNLSEVLKNVSNISPLLGTENNNIDASDGTVLIDATINTDGTLDSNDEPSTLYSNICSPTPQDNIPDHNYAIDEFLSPRSSREPTMQTNRKKRRVQSEQESIAGMTKAVAILVQTYRKSKEVLTEKPQTPDATDNLFQFCAARVKQIICSIVPTNVETKVSFVSKSTFLPSNQHIFRI
ncbi:unnamed protein product [Diabrotica balteata]|uniref:Uncharacterized protein n=1 Tax=Diabrotica balteata TaxID=107213 RepID=A0A9N9TFT1_DIABA|nr:unnamed protein product [Diabrotica balteata]